MIGVPELVRRAQASDREAFDVLYERCVGRVYAVCLRMSADRSDAERLTQDVFVRAWQRLSSFRGDSQFTSWLHRLTVNVVLEDTRSTRRRIARVMNVEDPTEFEHSGSSTSIDDRMDLERAIATLPPGARHALVLHDIEGFKHEEIARMLGIAVGTVKAQLHRARQLLRGRLGE
ncbi:MAG TPA: sigma-70 family RNA polymerase sigma factor [Longimicrobiales bacterium]|nr:sigma-70 family RNA polymerase sigma factor [Longimicrobiales bacterium]